MLIKKLWRDFGNIPITDDGKITQNWNRFPEGTDREEIWHWFEEEFGVSVVEDLMGM